MELIDTHAHLDSLDDVDAALERAGQAGVSAVVAVSENMEAGRVNLSLAKRAGGPLILPALGIHPGRIETQHLAKEFAFIEAHAGEVAALGEIGLDFWYKETRKDPDKKREQISVYGRLLDLAREHDLPVLIHTRGAWRMAFDMAREAGITTAVFHWYSGPLDVLEDILKAGYMISASPALAYSPESRRAMETAPVEQALIETDAPVYYKQGEGGFRAEPADVFRTLKEYVLLKQMDEERAAEQLTLNAKQVFAKFLTARDKPA